jgi:hypothetical protein
VNVSQFDSTLSFFATLVAATLAMPLASHAAPGACSAVSGNWVPAVVELYTSEGCDSCPPADRWFSGLKAEAAKGRVVPLAFHVDYWDYLGWKDRFGDAAYGARHREAASRGGAKVIYTPQVLVDGREYMQWRKAGGDRLPAAGQKPARAELRLDAALAANRLELSVRASSAQPARGAEAWIALYENGLSSDVKAGENRGVLLRHDFVVRRWLGPFAFDDGTLNIARAVDLPGDAVPAQSGVAVVAFDARGAVLQALALPLRDCAE